MTEQNFGLGFGVAIPFVNHLGFEMKLFDGGFSELSYAPKPEDLKGLCVLYASAAGKHITGQWLAVDGGVSVITGG